MQKIEIDLPMQSDAGGRPVKYEDLEVICQPSPNYDDRTAGEKLFQVMSHMPVGALVYLFDNPEFQTIYAAYKNYVAHGR